MKIMVEESRFVRVVKSFEVGKPDSLVVTIPRKIREELESKLGIDNPHFKVYFDGKRIILEPVE